MSAPGSEFEPDDQDTHRLYDRAAERAVLGAAMLSSWARDELSAFGLAVSEFYLVPHALVWGHIANLHGNGKPVDPITVMASLQAANALGDAGGPAYLHTLIAEMPSLGNAGYYARIVREHAVLRRLTAAGTRIVQLARTRDAGNSADVVAAALAEVEAVIRGTTVTEDRSSTATDIIDALIDTLDQPVEDDARGPRWGWFDIDAVMNPLTPGKLVIIGARPGVGKTLVIGCMAGHIAVEQGVPALIHSQEMTRVEIGQRLLASIARVDLGRIIRHELRDAELSKVMASQLDIDGKPLVVDETRGLTVPGLRASIRRHAPAVVFIDYLQLMRTTKPENRREEVSVIARELKEVAGDQGVCVVAASQLNRGAADRAPALSDLRESGEIEQAADEVILLHDDPLRMGERQVIVAKQRQGPAGATLALASQTHYARLSDLAR